MATKGYQRFCPVAKACDLLEPRWTMLVLLEMWSGSTRFSDIQRGVPGMSPSLLSRRLREMEEKGLVLRMTEPGRDRITYLTTAMAEELQPLIIAIGSWAHKHVDAEVTPGKVDDKILMWNIRRHIAKAVLPQRRVVVEFLLRRPDHSTKTYWLVVMPEYETDLCTIVPRFDVDLYIDADLTALTSAWIGHSSFAEEIDRERISLIGDLALARSLSKWLIRSCYAAA